MSAHPRRFSRLGLGLCITYLVLALAAVAWSALAAGDPKGRFVLVQLPIAIQAAVLDSLGLGSLLDGLSWVGAYIALALPTFALLYGVGALVERPFTRHI
jgi:hypothetical protein